MTTERARLLPSLKEGLSAAGPTMNDAELTEALRAAWKVVVALDALRSSTAASQTTMTNYEEAARRLEHLQGLRRFFDRDLGEGK